MKLGKFLSELTKPELEFLREQLNLSEEETEIFNLLCKGKQIYEIVMKLNISYPTINRRIKSIKNKIERMNAYGKSTNL